MFRTLRGFRALTRKGRNRPSNITPVRRGLEQLVERVLLSTIQWTNRGTSQSDSDLFNATYGTNAAAARAILEQAVLVWNRAIDNFHFRNVGQPSYASRDNTFNLYVFAADPGGGGRGSTTFNRFDPDGKPIQAAVFMDDNGGGAGWYFDTLPGDNSKFNGLVSQFQSTFTGAGAQHDDDDFYRTILHEIGHALGLEMAAVNFLEARGIDQIDGTSQLHRFSRNGVTASFTANGGGNFAIDVISRSSLKTTISTGNGNDTINVVRYRGRLTIDPQGGINENVLDGAQFGPSNVLNGGLGRDLLIAGAYSSGLVGGESDDILIAGTTYYDTDQTALVTIMAEWTSATVYATRVAHLKNGTNRVPNLHATTVHLNGGGNTFDGGGSFDLFFANLDALYGDPLTEELIAV